MPEPQVTDVARVPLGDAAGLRALLGPLLPGLHDFVARRAHDEEDADDLFAEVLLQAVASALAERGPALPLEAWLLRLALRVVRSDVERDPALRSGFGPETAALPTGVRECVARLPLEERDALGMRLVDGFSPSRIADVLGTDERSVLISFDQGFQRVSEQEGARAGRALRGIRPGFAPFILSPTREAAVWRRVEEEAGEYASANSTLRLPGWTRAAFAAVGLIALLLVGGHAYLLRSTPPRPLSAAVVPTVSVTAFPAPVEASVPPQRVAARPRVAVEDLPTTSLAGMPGELSYQETRADGRARVVLLDLEQERGDRTLLPLPTGASAWALSPDGRALAFNRRADILVRDTRRRGTTRYLFTLQSPESDTRRYQMDRVSDRFRAGAIAWRPDGKAIAIASEPVAFQGLELNRVFLFGAANGRPIASLDLRTDEVVSDLAWNPAGDALLVTTPRNVSVVRFRRDGTASRRVLAGVHAASWSHAAGSSRLLWMGPARRGAGNGRLRAFGLIGADGRGRRVLGRADGAWWYADGRHVLAAGPARWSPTSWAFSLLHPRAGTVRRSSLGRAPERLAEADATQLVPDGHHLSYTTEDGLFLVDYTTGAVLRADLLAARGVRISSVQWRGAPTPDPALLSAGADAGEVLAQGWDWRACHEVRPDECPR